MTTQEFTQKFVALAIHDKFNNLARIQQEFNKNKNKLNPEMQKTQEEIIKWMRNICFEDENFDSILPKN
jgi:hypothetical protein